MMIPLADSRTNTWENSPTWYCCCDLLALPAWCGVYLSHAKQRRVIGTVLFLIGGALVALCIVAFLSFHPS